ncbi:c-type cytochrome biogenesis protein CcsB [Streptosporangium sp. NBC_01755]|uniref:c-type cytochrome biogenesis protein CcsB n=1 Tax=unclassified Streptosporangium TaxID=2632669 RepID=UPI002DDA6419|nr:MULTISPECIES: c-type cytochrome biogenesis protein CcsB [unclassified Streptosporangium]WSA24831.1 c-type cytochrome biogenesis protein CcsB [Streptosporangium sp. NBC_01810]WSD03986.1 c-type cytochrome biogenesis protein CcsB [Streptosporangium sp. NBC_01755]
MPVEVDAGLATLSDQLILATVLLYVFAMIAYALDLAFSRSAAAQDRAAERPALATVGAGAAPGASESAPAEDEGPVDRTPSARAARAGMVAVGLSWLGWAANLGSLLTRGLAVDRWPWGNMYEFVVAMCFAAVSAFLFMNLRYRVRFLGAFVMVTAALGLGFAVRYLEVQAGPVVPALNTYWVLIHVSAAIVASGLFLMAGIAGILYLVRKDTAVLLPPRPQLERVAHRAIVIGFPIWTFAVIAGSLWADKAWGRYWGWDPKEIWAFITWIVYAAYLHAKATAGWKGKAATIVQLVACACLLFNLVGVNIFVGGLHSYAEVP